MPNPFERHGIEYLSPSAIGRLQDDLAYGLMMMIPHLKVYDPPGPALPRGTALDKALTFAAYHPDAPDEAILAHAGKVFADECARSGLALDAPETQKEAETIPAYLAAGVPEVRRWGPPEADQGKIEVRFDGIEVPVIGYYDLRYPDRLRELKTTNRMPSAYLARHARQACIYGHATGRDEWITYFSPREVRSFKVENRGKYLAEFGGVLRALRNLLSVTHDTGELIACVAPNYDNFVWSGAKAREQGRRLWGYAP